MNQPKDHILNVKHSGYIWIPREKQVTFIAVVDANEP